MPLYLYRNKNTGKEEEHILPISERESFLLTNTHLERIITSGTIVYELGNRIPVDQRFKDRISEIKKIHTKHNISGDKW